MKTLAIIAIAAIPHGFVGEWMSRPGQCGPHGDPGHMTVTPAGIADTPGSSCTQIFTPMDEGGYRVVTLCESDRGVLDEKATVQRWNLVEPDILSVIDSGHGEGVETTWAKCP